MREGSDLTIVAHSYTVRRALTVADRLAQDGIAVEVVDLRSLRPLDVETVCGRRCARRAARSIAEEGWSTYGVGAELAARIQRACFDDLDAPVERVGGAEVPMPYAKPLELAALTLEDKIEAAARSLLAECGLLKGFADGGRAHRCRASRTRWSGARSRAGSSSEGDAVAEGDVLAEIETDKATMELRAPTRTACC